MAYLVPLVYISPYSVQVLKQTPATAYYQLAASNAASAFGRIGSAWLSLKVGGPNILVFSLLSSSLLIFAWIGVTSSAGFWVWCCVWGFCSGIIISVNPVVVAHPTISHSPAVLGTRLGMQCKLCAHVAGLFHLTDKGVNRVQHRFWLSFWRAYCG
jgi:hypothetical protein